MICVCSCQHVYVRLCICLHGTEIIAEHQCDLDTSNPSIIQEAKSQIEQFTSCLFCHSNFSVLTWKQQNSLLKNGGNYLPARMTP